jgi:iron complex outermembrane recepter protein
LVRDVSRIISVGRRCGRSSLTLALLLSTSTLVALDVMVGAPARAQTAQQQDKPPAATPQQQQPPASTEQTPAAPVGGQTPQPTTQPGQGQGPLPQIHVSGQRPTPPRRARPPGAHEAARSARTPQRLGAPPTRSTTGAPGAASSSSAGGASGAASGPGTPATPLNGNAVASSASRLGLTVRQTPATVEVLDKQTIQDRGYRTTSEVGQGAVGVLDLDSAGAPAGFSMRGFTFGQVNVLYNGIWVGPQDITSRWMDTANLDQVEFLKGPSSLMTGLDAIGGSVNYVTRQPTSGPILNETDLSLDSYGSIRSHQGSGGTIAPNIDYRFDLTGSKLNSFIEGDYRDLTDLSTQWNYYPTATLKTFVAAEYQKDSGHAYWGTPLVPTSFAGAHGISGVVTGNEVSTFDGVTVIGPLTVDSRTLTTNYNVADNATGAQELWLRGGFEWSPNYGVTLKDQDYYYRAKRNWLDSETYSFDTGSVLSPNSIDRDRFFVDHDQKVVGNNLDFAWNTPIFFGMENRFAAQFQISRNWITFTEEGDPNDYPYDFVSVIDPVQGTYGPQFPDTRISRLDDIAGSFEDRLKLTNAFALIGGLRIEDITLAREGVNFDGTIPTGLPFDVTWRPVSYRAAYTYEPIPDLMFYSMYATAYNPAIAEIFSVTPNSSVSLTSARIYESGAKQLLWDNRAEWTFSVYDIRRNNVYVQINAATAENAGEIATKGIETAAAVRPIDGLKIWGNIAWTHARYLDFEAWTGNTPSNIAPIIYNAGASYRFTDWRWPVEVGGSVRHVGERYLFEDNATIMNGYTTADAYVFVDIPGRALASPEVDNVRVTFRVRNLTNAVYASFSDPGYPDQIYLGAPRTYEVATSVKW